MVTFKLSVFKMIKNALIFSLLGFKRNACANIGCAVLVLLELTFLFGLSGLLLPLAVGLPLLMMLSTMAYMKVFAAYAKIDQYMIAPYKKDEPTEVEVEAPIMHDDVTERERLEEIKRRNNIQ